MNQSIPKSIGGGAGCITIFGLPFFLAGLAITAIYFKGLFDWAEARSWVKTECRILEAAIKHNDDTSKATARYRYEFAGQIYESEKVSLYSGSDNVGDFQQNVAAELTRRKAESNGLSAYCYVNPKKPEEAVLYPNLRWSMQGFFAVFALSFPAVGAGLVLGGILGIRETRRNHRRRLAHFGQPWLWKREWAEKMIPSATKLPNLAVHAYTVWSLLIIAPMLLCVWLSGAFQVEPGSRILLIYPLLWSAPAWFSLRMIRSRMILGEAMFQPDHIPIHPGTSLTGSLFVKHPPSFRSAACLTLVCDKLITIQDSDGSTTRTETIWRHEESHPDEDFMRDFNGFKLPVSLEIPDDAPSTELDTDLTERHEWKLILTIPGTPAKAVFPLPVFRDPHAVVTKLPAAAQMADTAQATLETDLAARKIRAVFASDGTPASFDCPPSRFLGTIVALIAFDIIWSAISVFLIMKDAPLLFQVLWPATSVLIWILVAYLLLHRRKVIIEADLLTIHRSIGPVRWFHRFQKSEITGFSSDANLQSGNTQYYRIKLTSHAGKSSTLVDGITGQTTAAALTQRLESWRKRA